jgi:hypothetical protein
MACVPVFLLLSTGYTITGDVDIVENEDLNSNIRIDPKFREHRHFNRTQNFISIMNVVEDYAKQWAKRKEEELETLS